MNGLRTTALMVALTLMLVFIVSPLSGGGIFKLFSTHPPLEERIARLESLRPGA